MTAPGPPRLLLLQLVSTAPFGQYRSELFPFLQGFARAHGLAVRWARLGFHPDRQPRNPYVVELPCADLDALHSLLDELRPTHVVVNELLEDATLSWLEAHTHAAVAFIAARDVHLERVSALAPWLGLPVGSQPDELVDVAPPDFESITLNDVAAATAPLVRVLAGPSCVYARVVGSNPRFACFAGTPVAEHRGCSFCDAPCSQGYAYRTPPIELAVRQIRAARQAYDGDAALVFLLEAGLLFPRIGTLLDAVLQARLAPCSFMLPCRADELLRMSDDIEARLPGLARAGHSIAIENMGVESFSQPENERMNKGITLEHVRGALARLRQWRRDFPGAFHFDEDAGLSYITYTPWTTPQDLRAGVDAHRQLDLRPNTLFLCSRLRMLPGRPITELARAEGLLVSEFDDAALSAAVEDGCLTRADDVELPWRFAHPQTAAIYAIVTRLFATGRAAAMDDEAKALALAVLARVPQRLRDRAAFFAALVDTAIATPAAITVPELLSALLAAEGCPFDIAAVAATVRRTRRLRDRLTPVLHRLSDQGAFGAHEFTSAQDGAGAGLGQGLVLRFQQRDEAIDLLVAPAGTFPDPFRRTRRFDLSYRNDTPLDTPERQHVALVVTRILQRMEG